MGLVKSFIMAFSTYSKVPMPQIEWDENNMKYSLCFFPWVGALIGALIYGWFHICNLFGINETAMVLIGVAIPIIVTGGFHIDGFMDTCDALHSYAPKEKKLEILKDPHIGAFSVIMLLLYYLIYISGVSMITSENALLLFCFIFFISRTLSGISVVSFKSAKNNGMLKTQVGGAHKKGSVIALVIQLIIVLTVMSMINLMVTLGIVAVIGAFFAYYRFKCYKEFGGVTGDTAGYFVCMCELLGVLVVAGFNVF